MDTYKILKAIEQISTSFNKMVTSDEISKQAGFKITDNDLIYYSESGYITRGSKYINGKSVNAYCLLPEGYNFINEEESNKTRDKITKRSYYSSIIAAITGIVSLVLTIIQFFL